MAATLIAISGAIAPASGLFAQCDGELANYTETEIPADQLLIGRSLGVDGDLMIAGARTDLDSWKGKAFIYRWNSGDGGWWEEEVMLEHPSPYSYDQFGRSVDVYEDTTNGDLAIVGVPFDEYDGGPGNSGSAYIYRYNGSNWVQQLPLAQDDPEGGDHFGISVAIGADVAVIGADYRDTASANKSGAAFIFRNNAGVWEQEDDLTGNPGDIAVGDHLGRAVDLNGDGTVFIAGAPDAGDEAGAAYVFSFNGSSWSQEAKLVSQDLADHDLFGTSVAISEDGDVAVVGAFRKNDSGLDVLELGAAYVFRSNGGTWTQEAKLLPWDPDGPIDDDDHRFGCDVSISGEWIIVGTGEPDLSDEGARLAYAFRYDGSNWISHTILHLEGFAEKESLGSAVAIDNGRVLVGMPKKNVGSMIQITDCGAVYYTEFPTRPEDDCDDNGIFDTCDLLECDGSPWCADCDGNGILDECDIANGTYDDCNEDGVPDICSMNIEIEIIVDCSGSMDENPSLCDQLTDSTDGLIALLTDAATSRGLYPHIWARSISGSDPDFDCLNPSQGGDPTVADVYTPDLPDYVPCNELYDYETIGQEDWGPATAIISTQKYWSDGIRIIIPISDEGPFGGSSGDCDDYDDPDSIDCAIEAAIAYSVYVYPVTGNSPDDCAIESMDALAEGTQDPECSSYGTVVQAVDDVDTWPVDLVAAITAFLDEATISKDCNGNGQLDECDIADGDSDDCDGDGIPDECIPKISDITGPDEEPDGVVDVLDLLLVLAEWGINDPPNADITGLGGSPDGIVDVLDLLMVLCQWDGIPPACVLDCIQRYSGNIERMIGCIEAMNLTQGSP